jgi:hypothetical protein
MIKRLLFYTLLLVAARIYQLNITNKDVRHSYVASINCPTLKSGLIKNYLDEFNNIGHNSIIKFDKDTRPITIEEFVPDKSQEYLLGYTYVKKSGAKVFLKSTLEEYRLKQVLLHEMMHSYGYDHVNIKGDLMYPYIDDYEDYTPEYIKYYHKLHKIIYGK